MHTPEQVAASIKEIIKQKYGNLNAYAKEKNITPTQLYALLNGKEYLSLFSAVRFSTDFDLNIDYCTKGELPVLSPEHDYNMLLEAATEFFYAVRDEDKARDEFERKYDDLSSEEREQSKKYLEKLRIDKAKAGCALVDLLNAGWGEVSIIEVIVACLPFTFVDICCDVFRDVSVKEHPQDVGFEIPSIHGASHFICYCPDGPVEFCTLHLLFIVGHNIDYLALTW